MNLEERLGPEWYKLLGPLFSEDWMLQLGRRIKYVENHGHLRPHSSQIFEAYRLCQPSQLKVLIIGQDSYPHLHANGLAFSTTEPNLPLTLRIVSRELDRTGYGPLQSGDLTPWAQQGVMLLNSILTCEQGNSLAHKGWGWEKFVAATLKHIGELKQPIVVLCWGKAATNLVSHYMDWGGVNINVLTACHPVAESYSEGRIKFVGCGHFQKCNEWLTKQGVMPIYWTKYGLFKEVGGLYLQALEKALNT